MPPLGERFRAAREARGLSLSDVAEQIRIRSVYLSAIEDENWSAIGAPVYIRGFLRTYARYLTLDPEEMVKQFNAVSGEQPALEQAPAAGKASESYIAVERQSRTLSPVLWIAALVAVVLVAFVFYNELTLRQRGSGATVAAASPQALASSQEQASASATPLASPESSPAAGASPGSQASPAHLLQVIVSSPSWLRITVDGSVSMEGTFPAGTVKQFHGKIAVLRIGNAGGVEVSVDGKNLGKLGSTGDVVERSFAL